MKHALTLFCLLFALGAGSLSAVKAQVDVNDSLALVDLYNSTNGPGWYNNTNWLTNNPVSTWYGITVTGTRVTSVSLNNNKLSGPIPSSIGNLGNLTGLYLSGNLIFGNIPSSIGNLTNLQYLELIYSQLNGPIPPSIVNLSHLVILDLSRNELSGSIPFNIGKLVELFRLDLSYNQLSGEIPYTFKKLTNLFTLYLNFNQLSHSSNYNYLKSSTSNLFGSIGNNLFTFNGLEYVTERFPRVDYHQQAIIPVHQIGNTLAVYAGGTLSNNTYNWYKIGQAGSTTINGDSTFTPTQDGEYYVQVTNSIAIKLTLYSDTIDFTMSSSVIANNKLASDINSSKLKTVISVSPNPANSSVQVQLNGTATIILTNSAGKVMLTRTINNKGEINVSALANGVYFIKNSSTGEVQQLIVSH